MFDQYGTQKYEYFVSVQRNTITKIFNIKYCTCISMQQYQPIYNSKFAYNVVCH